MGSVWVWGVCQLYPNGTLHRSGGPARVMEPLVAMVGCRAAEGLVRAPVCAVVLVPSSLGVHSILCELQSGAHACGGIPICPSTNNPCPSPAFACALASALAPLRPRDASVISCLIALTRSLARAVEVCKIDAG